MTRNAASEEAVYGGVMLKAVEREMRLQSGERRGRGRLKHLKRWIKMGREGKDEVKTKMRLQGGEWIGRERLEYVKI